MRIRPTAARKITETDLGRAFEVTPRSDIIWEYDNPHRAGPRGEFIASLFELVRLSPDFDASWAEAPSPRSSGPVASRLRS